MEAITKKQVKSAMAVMISITETIREAGAAGVPGGTLYAVLMAKGFDYQQYQQIERTLLNTRLVAKSGDVLRWVGPEVRG